YIGEINASVVWENIVTTFSHMHGQIKSALSEIQLLGFPIQR
ncbi:MAG: hypothetical protein FD188_3569, partial [Ignavibacteria bacterium]